MKTSAGCLVRQAFPDGPRFLLVHPSGNYNRRAPWSIPKGELDPGEDAEACALRETLEETGIACRILRPLGEVVYRKSRKRVLAFLAEPTAPLEGAVLTPASWEVDRVELLPLEEARQVIHPDQAAFLDRAAGGETAGGEAPPAP
ncbi:MAG: NUDIX domain-containing protein [Planctomycetes bacterium]|nr:NUDIX domain-containing protein [Planctomycetota bacterium]